MSAMNILRRSGAKIISNYEYAVIKKLTYDELGIKKLVLLTGYKPNLFENVGKSSIALTLLDEKKMMEIMIGITGDLKNKEQRILKKKAEESLIHNYQTYHILFV